MDTHFFLLIAITSVISLLFYLSFLNYRKRKKEQLLSKKLENELNNLKESNQKLNDKEKVLSQIINCANKGLVDVESFQISMNELVKTLREILKSEYCAIGKVINDIVEDYATDYDKYEDYERQKKQQDCYNKAKKVNIKNHKYLVCRTLNNKKKQISRFSKKEIEDNYNENYELYKQLLKSGTLKNTIIIPLRDDKFVNYGYIQIINSIDYISSDNIMPFKDSLLQLVQLIVKKEEDKIEQDKHIKERDDFINDSNFIRSLILNRDNIEELLKKTMAYLSEQFNAAIISFRIPVLNGREKVPLFYLRRCYVNKDIQNRDMIMEYYNDKRILKSKNQLGGNGKLKCCNKGAIIHEESMDSDYYDLFKIDLEEKTLIMPVFKDIGKNECTRFKRNEICGYNENPECVDRFKKIYGLFKLRLFKNVNNRPDEEENMLEKTKERLSRLSEQITLVFNSIVDKCENESLRIFRENLKEQQFLKIRDFDGQFVKIIKKSTRAKECSIYRFRKDEDGNEELFLSETTVKKFLIKGVEYEKSKIIHELRYSLTDDKSVIVKVFNHAQDGSKYLYNLHNYEYNKDFIELYDNDIAYEDNSYFLIPIIKKGKEKTCMGVVELLGKQIDNHSISTSFWEQDKELVDFIVDIFTRISEADNERLNFLSNLGHELITPINEIVSETDFLRNSYGDKKTINHDVVLKQFDRNLKNCFLFKYIISDIEHIYSSSKNDIIYDVKLIEEPNKILLDVIDLFQSTVPINTYISKMPALWLDPNRIKQVFINILKNAIRYSYQSQPIEIYYKSPDENTEKQHEIKFVNYGIGILEEDKERIFELYIRGKNAAQRRASGSGMGLYIAKEIMKAHSGDCIVRNLKDPTEISLLFPKY